MRHEQGSSADRTPGLGFLVDVVMRGTVLGIEPVSEPDQIGAVLGPECAENRQRNVSWRDYGLVEYSWTRASTSHPWRPDRMTVQVYRLNTIGADSLNAVVAARFGPLPSDIPLVSYARH